MDCGTVDNAEARCEISVGYDDGTVEETVWWTDNSLNGINLPSNVVVDSKTGYLPQSICWDRYNAIECHIFALDTKPAAQTPQTIINQMPTTGAPTGLSNVGLLAVGVGLAGVAAVLIRRRRMV